MKLIFLRTAVPYLVWLIISILMWCWALVEINALYPDWDDNRGRMLGWIIRSVLIFSWSLWFLPLFSDSLKRARFWFKIGMGLALALSLIRLVFYKELNELLNAL